MTANDTTANDDEQTTEQADEQMTASQRVLDFDEPESKHLRAIAKSPRIAKNARVAAVGKSVAQLNQDYPETDAVWVCVYESDLDESFGARWKDWSPAYLAFMVGNYGLQTYSFPRSRLGIADERTAEKWEQAKETRAENMGVDR